jgi:hypothetical protein
MKLLIIWLMTPLEPREIIRPTNTLTPLNASVPLPGRYGYATTTAKSHSRFRVDPGKADTILLHRLEQQVRQPDEEARDQKDDRDSEQARHRPHEPEAQVRCGAEEELAQRLAPGSRIRETPEDERQPPVGHESGGGEHHQHDQPAREFEHARGAQERRIANRKSL